MGKNLIINNIMHEISSVDKMHYSSIMWNIISSD